MIAIKFILYFIVAISTLSLSTMVLASCLFSFHTLMTDDIAYDFYFWSGILGFICGTYVLFKLRLH